MQEILWDNSEKAKIKLYENFRSRKSILDLTNFIFTNIMSKSLGDINYNEEEYLNPGLEYEETNFKTLGKPELHIIDLFEESDDDEYDELIDNIELEARFVAQRIKSIIEDKQYIWDKKTGYRKVEFKDIAILLRTTTGVANIYEKELMNLGYPVFCDTSTNYFESIEIQTIMNLLRIVDNPMQDIPLVSVLRSPIIGLTDNELTQIRLVDKNKSFYEALLLAKNNIEEETLKNKIDSFILLLEKLQEENEYLKLDELIWDIYEKTGYYNYVSLMKDGNLKTANLKMLFEKAKEYQEGSFKGLYNFISFIDRVTKRGSDMGAPKLIGENENVIRIMSIHKSKGLEFPIVFLSGTGKFFNMQDMNESIILHQDIGFGPKYINYERKIQYNTLAKEAIKEKVKTELKSEEMRLFYVALTRAREKLVITGISKNLKKSLKDKEDLLNANISNKSINSNIVAKAKSYLDWLEMVLIHNESIKEIINIESHKKNEIQQAEKEEENKELNLNSSKVNDKTITEKLEWKYPHYELTTIEGKSSVSNITKVKEVKYSVEKMMPEFLKDTKNKISAAERGTVTHLVLQKLDYKENYTLEKINNLLEELQTKKIITEVQKRSVQTEKILNYTKTDLFKEIKEAKKAEKEKAFYINIPAKEIYNNNIDEPILVQGIIDLYFINKNNELILVDFKTDYVENNDEKILINKYKEQLNLYAKALESALKVSVSKIYIYSLYLDKEIEIKEK